MFAPLLSRFIVFLAALLFPLAAAAQTPHLQRFLVDTDPASLVAEADGFGAIREDLPVAPLLRGSERIGWAFITSDFVGTTGYSGKPIHVMVAIGDDSTILGLNMVDHSEPIVLIGIPDSRIRESIAGQIGINLADLANGGEAPELNIISGATVTIMVIDDSIQRSGIRVARMMGLGGLTAQSPDSGPQFDLNAEAEAADNWFDLVGDGTVRRMTLDVGQVNAAFEQLEDPRAARRALTDPAEDTYIDLYTALVSVPGIGREIMGEAEYGNLTEWLEEGDHAIFVGGRGPYSFKGSGYVRGGIFDRIVLIQGDISVRFRDRDHRRLGDVAAQGTPALNETDIFRISADTGFDPAEPWRLQLLVQRDVAALERAFTTFDLGYQLPRAFVTERARPVAAMATDIHDDQAEREAQMALIERIWNDQKLEIGVLIAMLVILTGAFFFQSFLTRSERVTYWFRMSFLTVTLFFLGWYANAQLSVVNILALFQSLIGGFSWQAFLLDPLTFILWFSVAAAMIFWGRGAFCGWLCPFGALQELTNQIARKLRVPQITLPWGLHERLWPIKYMIFLALFGASLVSLEWGERLAEVEPFKTAIVLRFDRAWPFVLFALALLFAGLFIERFYCRYLCPLGAALAIPARMRMFDWLKRYKECGNPCQTCANECFVQAIHPTGEINPNECLNCLHCQVLYQSEQKCPVVIKQLKRRQTVSASVKSAGEKLDQITKSNTLRKET
ncbi:NosR/NirI family protein [Pararhodobacter oceanensis]|uniref:Regulatory protein NosR n=1 Tax=Pararhodobacter oceanensis TaxID=2172121 RepID=A0A2T8HXZ5_9RHOB|nr:NosR/NirI family protein [Pararhodobacter oceanensis]PVH30264.1 regulatory protein NosR [Pararhodobacter oceanensis]